VCVVGHLRAVKDPLLAARAARRLRPSSRVRIVQIGKLLDADLAPLVAAELRENRRYAWLGALSRRATLECIARARLVALTSRSEGGANVVAEAVRADTPLLATRIDGVLGQLGSDYAGCFEVGDVEALARLMERAEFDPAFYASLAAQCAARRPLFAPEAEREAWRALLSELANETVSRGAPR